MSEEVRAQVQLAEFNALRTEITSRAGAQNTLTTFTLAATGALGSFAISAENHRLYLLLLVPLNAATALLWLENAHSIFKAGNYIRDELWVGIRNLDSSSPITSWEEYLSPERQRRPIWLERSIFLVPFFLLFLGPIVGALVGAVAVIDQAPFKVFWALDAGLAVFVFATWTISVRKFLGKSEPVAK